MSEYYRFLYHFTKTTLNNFNISSEISLEGATYEIYNTMGSLLNNGKLKENNVNVQALPAGFYTLVIKKNNTFIAKSFIKING